MFLNSHTSSSLYIALPVTPAPYDPWDSPPLFRNPPGQGHALLGFVTTEYLAVGPVQLGKVNKY